MKSRTIAALLGLLAATPAWADRDSFLSDGEIAVTLLFLLAVGVGVLWALWRLFKAFLRNEPREAEPPLPVARIHRDQLGGGGESDSRCDGR